VLQLDKGEAVIVYDDEMETCNITTAAQAQANAHSETE
jgi:uncharacterized protein YheU (UPF0270 family)